MIHFSATDLEKKKKNHSQQNLFTDKRKLPLFFCPSSTRNSTRGNHVDSLPPSDSLSLFLFLFLSLYGITKKKENVANVCLTPEGDYYTKSNDSKVITLDLTANPIGHFGLCLKNTWQHSAVVKLELLQSRVRWAPLLPNFIGYDDTTTDTWTLNFMDEPSLAFRYAGVEWRWV